MRSKSLNEVLADKILCAESQLIVVNDPDSLLGEKVLEKLENSGYAVFNFLDPISFRYRYERDFRDKNPKKLVIVVSSDYNDPYNLPFDVLNKSIVLDFEVSTFFPKLSRTALLDLTPDEIAKLYKIMEEPRNELSTRETRELILKQLFDFDLSKKYSLIDFLSWLMKIHYSNIVIREEMAKFIYGKLKDNPELSEIPIKTLILSKDNFLAFLQERWPMFLKGKVAECVCEGSSIPLEYPGPYDIPFDHPDLKIYIDTFFAEGLLEPVPVNDPGRFEDSWISFGIDTEESECQRFRKLLEIVRKEMPSTDSNFKEWTSLAWRLAELSLHIYLSSASNEEREKFLELQKEIDKRFLGWVLRKFSSLLTLISRYPVTVQNVLPQVRKRYVEKKKVALIVVDGMSILQWLTLSKHLKEHRQISQRGILAFIPTLTSVSRKVIFSGRLPMYLGNVLSTSGEERLWKEAWSDIVRNSEIVYLNEPGKKLLKSVEESLRKNVRVLGIVIRELDEIMHGEILGIEGLISATKLWYNRGILKDLLKLLITNDYHVILTSDHGNVLARGIGKPSEGVAAESKGERVRIYKNESLRQTVHSKYPEAIAWKPIGLPENFFPLIAGGRTAFANFDEETVCHGGTTVDELIIPFVELWKG
ncbi:MAG: BREX-3 system phosphatase PglZ [Thermotogaceae bacterium]|nr:BREX-3 system phosphatase PglZ [Thermotogaceae bacterium]